MESLQTIVSPGPVIYRSALDDSELICWRKSRRWQRNHNYSDSQLTNCRTLQPLPELLSYGIDYPPLLSASDVHRMPKHRRQSIPLCVPEKDRSDRVFRRSASGSQLAVMNASAVYAGARFSEAPSPKLLPLPPRHWLDRQQPGICGEMTKQLKSVLRVQ